MNMLINNLNIMFTFKEYMYMNAVVKCKALKCCVYPFPQVLSLSRDKCFLYQETSAFSISFRVSSDLQIIILNINIVLFIVCKRLLWNGIQGINRFYSCRCRPFLLLAVASLREKG